MMSIYNVLLTTAIFAACSLFCGGLYCFLLILLKVPSSKTTKAIKAVGARSRPTPAGYLQTYDNISLFVSRILPMGDDRKQRMAANLKIAHINMPPEHIGGGLVIHHGFSTIVAAKEIGENCKIFQQVTIGYNEDENPVLEDNVTVCAGAIVIGGVHLHKGAFVGAGAVVVKDVPENTTVVGVPARAIECKRK